MDKVRENKARRSATRQGLVLEKSRRRDERASGYGLYGLRMLDNGGMVNPCGTYDIHSWTLDEVEQYLTS